MQCHDQESQAQFNAKPSAPTELLHDIAERQGYGASHQGQKSHLSRDAGLAQPDQALAQVGQPELHESDIVIIARRHHANKQQISQDSGPTALFDVADQLHLNSLQFTDKQSSEIRVGQILG